MLREQLRFSPFPRYDLAKFWLGKIQKVNEQQSTTSFSFCVHEFTPTMADSKKRWTVTYTKHVKQKRKVYQDGFLVLNVSTGKVFPKYFHTLNYRQFFESIVYSDLKLTLILLNYKI
jgi:hypothetical protein